MLKRQTVCVLVLTVVLAALPLGAVLAEQSTKSPAAAQTEQQKASPSNNQGPTATFGPNVRVDVTITDQGGGGSAAPIRKTISLTAASGLSRSNSVRSGVNVPVPSTTMAPVAAGGVNTVPITSYNYRTMGLSLDVREVEVRDNQVRVGLTVEYSPLDETEKPTSPSPTPVSYSNFSQSFQLVLDNGKPIVAAETSDPVPNRSRKLSVEVKATILK